MKKKIILLAIFFTASILFSGSLQAQRRKKKAPVTNSTSSKGNITKETFSGINFRSIGPAFMSGRIADIAFHPEDESTWYVAVGSGGVWKTENAGITWESLFDGQGSYSIGSVTIDPNNPHTIWVGTGENVGGRHMGYGDGIYKSEDDGKTWKNMGLKNSQHISTVIIHPGNSDVVYVAVQGPLWSKGGERGFYKTTDGGETWKKTLGDNEWTGVTDIVTDPRNPDLIYAATWQRHRTVAAYLGGGPNTALHKSTDGGETWEKLTKGLPTSNMGKIGLAISPQQPDVLYAAIELDLRTGGVYKSTNRGASWNKMSDAVSGATGPHYYQELYASPHQFDKLYLVDVRMQVSEDGGKSFRRMNEEYKHSDNHAIAFKKDDPDYILVGSDGGLYESFDGEKNWRHIDNLPITQYYKVAVDDTKPFYNIYGGTQDTNTHGGPSRTDNLHGIRNADWFITVFADGHQPATEPGNPDIVYSTWQQGNLVRTDRTTGEIVYIKPQPEAGEDYERYNWDAPILISPHKPTRLYHGSQRVWKSEDRGDTWTAISSDLTKDLERVAQPIMGSVQSIDNPWDLLAMSSYSTITSLAESPKQEGLLYAGTDDGILQITEDGGNNWRKVNVGAIPGIPATAFVNDIKADLYDANKVYVVLDNHKFGDFKPYLVKSNDKGRTWQTMNSNLPDRTLLWRIVQDHERSDLFFLATEFGIYFTLNAGSSWTQFTGSLPTISFRDLAIQKRENDLVAASFGRSFYVLDDYSFLREVSEKKLNNEGSLFPIRKAYWYIERGILGFSEKANKGAAYYNAKNPDFGATFTYYLKDDYQTDKEIRQSAEKEALKAKKAVGFQGWDALATEAKQQKPTIWLTVKDLSGKVIRRIKGSTKKGMHRIAWDLRYPATNPLRINAGIDPNNLPQGQMVAPGKFTVSLSKQIDGVVTILDGPREFEVVPLREGALPSASPQEVASFWQEIADFQKNTSALTLELNNAVARLKAMSIALDRTTSSPGNLDKQMHDAMIEVLTLNEELNGDPLKIQVGEKNNPTIADRINHASTGTRLSTYGPTPSHKRSMEIAKEEYRKLSQKAKGLLNGKIPSLEKLLREAGAPWIEGQSIPIK